MIAERQNINERLRVFAAQLGLLSHVAGAKQQDIPAGCEVVPVLAGCIRLALRVAKEGLQRHPLRHFHVPVVGRDCVAGIALLELVVRLLDGQSVQVCGRAAHDSATSCDPAAITSQRRPSSLAPLQAHR